MFLVAFKSIPNSRFCALITATWQMSFAMKFSKTCRIPGYSTSTYLGTYLLVNVSIWSPMFFIRTKIWRNCACNTILLVKVIWATFLMFWAATRLWNIWTLAQTKFRTKALIEYSKLCNVQRHRLEPSTVERIWSVVLKYKKYLRIVLALIFAWSTSQTTNWRTRIVKFF